MMDPKDFERMLDYIEQKYGTRTIALGYHAQGCGGNIYLSNMAGKHIGSVAEVCAKAFKKVKKNGKQN